MYPGAERVVLPRGLCWEEGGATERHQEPLARRAPPVPPLGRTGATGPTKDTATIPDLTELNQAVERLP